MKRLIIFSRSVSCYPFTRIIASFAKKIGADGHFDLPYRLARVRLLEMPRNPGVAPDVLGHDDDPRPEGPAALSFSLAAPENLEVLAPSALEQTVRCLRPLHAKHEQALCLPPDLLPACFERTARHLLEASDAHRFDIAPTAGAVMTLHQALCAEEPLDGPSPDDAFFPPETVERLPKPARLGARTTQLRGLRGRSTRVGTGSLTRCSSSAPSSSICTTSACSTGTGS